MTEPLALSADPLPLDSAVASITLLEDPGSLKLLSAIARTRFGFCNIAAAGTLVCSLSLHGTREQAAIEERLLTRLWPTARIARNSRSAIGMATELTEDPHASRRWLPAVSRASAFQLAVWAAATAIPAGQTRSYGEIAAAIGAPAAARAVGQALSRNPVAILIPCHRVLPAPGKIGNYRWGTPRKQQLLDWERERSATRIANHALPSTRCSANPGP
jgi:AraC family transcriptional regulator of adaptative response/methylated-DNA-[protein]-cysteine methyltransferase